ncbi:hypothetical protein [Pseudonocardia xishanensis]|uniref:Tryptophan-associated transmembrane protein n=1 Tax=Pseudonocardia xishanensis TaxID=630995 RepID=A0ABP8RPM0_9PSEU
MTTGHDPHAPVRADDRPGQGGPARPGSPPPAIPSPRRRTRPHAAGPLDPPTSLIPTAPRPPAPRPPMPDAPLGSPIGFVSRRIPKARRRFPLGAVVGILGAGLVAAAVVLPWATVGGALPITGLDGADGRIAVGAGGALLLAAALRFQSRAGVPLRILAAMAGLAAAGVAALDLTSLGRLTGDLAALVQPGPGLPVLAAGGVVGLSSAFLHSRTT